MTEKRRSVWLIRVIAVVVAISCAVIFIPWLTVWAYLKPLPDSVQEQVDDAINFDLDGIIIYADRKDKEPEFYSAGWRDRDLETPADPQVLFKIGSISKLYVAAAAAMLISDNKLALDDTLADYFPELVGRIENADRITLRMLLQHTSGIPDWIDDPDFPWTTSFADVNEYFGLILDGPAEFEPGSSYDYSNTNYLLVGAILDKTLGYHHQQYIQSEILTPLGLRHTFGALSDVDATKLSNGYFIGYDGDVKMLDIVAPGGSMIATAEDTGIFLRALNDGSLFNDDEQEIYSSIYEYGHTGLWPGYSSIARYHEDMDAVLIQFVNTSGGNSWMISEIIYNRIVRIMCKQEF